MAMDEPAQRWGETPGCDHPVEGGRVTEARAARREGEAGGRRRHLPGGHHERRRAARAAGAMEKRIERAHAIGAGILARSDLAAEAAGPREEPAQHLPGRALNSLTLQHRSLSAAPEHAIPCPAPPGRADCAQPGSETGTGGRGRARSASGRAVVPHRRGLSLAGAPF